MKDYLYIYLTNKTIKDMKIITITKSNAEFIKKTATKVTNDAKVWNSITYHLPVFYRLTNVSINVNGVDGLIDGNYVDYAVKFTNPAQEILQIVN